MLMSQEYERAHNDEQRKGHRKKGLLRGQPFLHDRAEIIRLAIRREAARLADDISCHALPDEIQDDKSNDDDDQVFLIHYQFKEAGV